MRIKELIETLERVSSKLGVRDAHGLGELAGELRDLCGELALAGQTAGQIPGAIDVEHALRIGMVETIAAHATINAIRYPGRSRRTSRRAPCDGEGHAANDCAVRS